MGRLTSNLKERTLQFGTDALAVVAHLPKDARGWIVGKQLGRSATSVGANVWEADFAYKISVARKETSETQYWLELAGRSQLLPEPMQKELASEAEELIKILATIVRKTPEHMRRPAG